MAIVNLSVLLDIHSIVLGGEYLDLGEDFIKGIYSIIKYTKNIQIKVSKTTLGNKAGIYGCFSVGTDYILQGLSENSAK